MDKRFSAVVGVTLVVLGGLALLASLAAPVFGMHVSPSWPLGTLWGFWPLLVIGLGLLFVIPPLVARGRRGLGALFIPGLPVVTTGALLLFASLLGWWDVWSWLWPQEVLALALGFLFAAITMRSVGLVVPAIIIGLNGVVFQFCALTGLWEAWSVLWTIEPLSVGLALLLVGAKTRSAGPSIAGLIFCALAGMGLILMTLVLADWWLFSAVGAAALIGVGCLLAAWAVIGRPSSPRMA